MTKIYKKMLILTAKLLVAGSLLGWVLSKSHWSDYVTSLDGKKTYAVVKAEPSADNPKTLTVVSGILDGSKQWTADAAAFLRPERTSTPIQPGFATTISRMNRFFLLAGFFGFLCSLLVVAVRWWFLLRIQDIFIKLWEAVRLTFLGQFFNTLLPSTVGGDLVKAYYVSKHTPKKGAVLVSVIVDRVLGLTELTMLATIMLAVVLLGGMASLDDLNIRRSAIAIGVVIVLICGAMIFLFSRRFRRFFRLEKLYSRLSIAHHIAAAGDAAILYRQRALSLIKAVLMTFGAHLMWVGSLALLGFGLFLHGPGPHWYEYFLYIPLIYIIGAIPIAPGSVGLIEGLYLAFFPANPSQTLAFALLARLIPIFWGLPGIIVAVTGARLPKADAVQAELGLAEEPPVAAQGAEREPVSR